MPIHKRNNDILTVDQLEELNSYQLHKYQVREQARRRRKEIQSHFAEELNQSMTKYKESDTIKSEVKGNA